MIHDLINFALCLAVLAVLVAGWLCAGHVLVEEIYAILAWRRVRRRMRKQQRFTGVR